MVILNPLMSIAALLILVNAGARLFSRRWRGWVDAADRPVFWFCATAAVVWFLAICVSTLQGHQPWLKIIFFGALVWLADGRAKAKAARRG